MNFKTLADQLNGTLVDSKFVDYMFRGVSIDTRTIAPKELFVAITGEFNDGHDYLDKALDKKCGGLLVNSSYGNVDSYIDRVPVVTVDDTYQAMKKLAIDYLNSIAPIKIGITGSNGKTTTKDFVYSLINSLNNHTFRTPGNLNNLYGLPLSIFKMPLETEYAVFELGISTPGEMTRLTEIMTPDLAVITNVGATHLETLGSVAGVAEAKLELADAMDKTNPVLINADNETLVKASSKRSNRFVTFGINNKADFMAVPAGINAEGYPVIRIDNTNIVLRLFGLHQVYNILVAYAVGKTLGLEFDIDRLNNIDYSFAQYRGEIEYHDGLTIIADCYNANPVSMRSGLESFNQYISNIDMTGHRAIAVIGDMLELGTDEVLLHQEIGSYLAETRIDYIITVGKLSRHIKMTAVEKGFDADHIISEDDTDTAGEALLQIIKRGDILYFKASRGIGLEKILFKIKASEEERR